MSLIEEIQAKLLKFPDVHYEIDDKRIRVFPTSENGFKVELFEPANNYFMVFFNGWHEDFTESEKALNCFALGLSTQCRLLEYHRGDNAYKWILEVNRPTGWVRQSVTALIFFRFWRRRKIRVLQNQLLREKDPT